jgi:hypothetical protein
MTDLSKSKSSRIITVNFGDAKKYWEKSKEHYEKLTKAIGNGTTIALGGWPSDIVDSIMEALWPHIEVNERYTGQVNYDHAQAAVDLRAELNGKEFKRAQSEKGKRPRKRLTIKSKTIDAMVVWRFARPEDRTFDRFLEEEDIDGIEINCVDPLVVRGKYHIDATYCDDLIGKRVKDVTYRTLYEWWGQAGKRKAAG